MNGKVKLATLFVVTAAAGVGGFMAFGPEQAVDEVNETIAGLPEGSFVNCESSIGSVDFPSGSVNALKCDFQEQSWQLNGSMLNAVQAISVSATASLSSACAEKGLNYIPNGNVNGISTINNLDIDHQLSDDRRTNYVKMTGSFYCASAGNSVGDTEVTDLGQKSTINCNSNRATISFPVGGTDNKENLIVRQCNFNKNASFENGSLISAVEETAKKVYRDLYKACNEYDLQHIPNGHVLGISVINDFNVDYGVTAEGKNQVTMSGDFYCTDMSYYEANPYDRAMKQAEEQENGSSEEVKEEAKTPQPTTAQPPQPSN
jgi:hypothetical protein